MAKHHWYDWITGKAEIDVALDKANDLFHKVTGVPTSDERRNQQSMMNEQLNAQRESTKLQEDEIRTAQASQDAEKRRIQEKQIRGMRNQYRPSGFLNNQALGGQSGLPTKLGTA